MLSQTCCDFADLVSVDRPQATTTFGGLVDRLIEKTKGGIKSKTMMAGARRMGNLPLNRIIPSVTLLEKTTEVRSFT